jgi:hypothetical protein
MTSYDNDHRSQVLSAPTCCEAITGLHIHAGDIIRLVSATVTNEGSYRSGSNGAGVGMNDTQQRYAEGYNQGKEKVGV